MTDNSDVQTPNTSESSSARKRMWGGRFQEATDRLVQDFNASIDVDRHLALHDIAGSIAHATMLAEQDIISADDAEAIIGGLRDVERDINAGNFVWSVELEDVHMNIERALTERVGSVGGKLHTARSRNDQVATDFRLWLRDTIHTLIAGLQRLRTVLVDLAELHDAVIMPGYTHLQVAQPILLSHHLLAYYQMFSRDQARLEDSLERVNVSPLGAGALAGTTFPINRRRTAELLGFSSVAANSLDAVSDRDFALEFLAAASIAMMHFSRLSEELIVWSSQEFGFVTLPDSHTTGSSIMPQKKNPDVCELVRGQTGRVYGSLIGLLTVMKGLPLAYNKDMQEDKEGVMDAAKTLEYALALYVAMLPKVTVHAERTYHAAGRAYSNATDLADYLVRKGLPFREAHEVVGKLVALGLNEGKDLQELDVAQMRAVSELIGEDVFEVLGLEHVVNTRRSEGGTAYDSVVAQIKAARASLDQENAQEHADVPST
ncbi:MAG: argininosuccinate lyase [Trueperaceae bacterium]|nr:argininosuccinate lyase [Trueperaceae bacterium]